MYRQNDTYRRMRGDPQQVDRRLDRLLGTLLAQPTASLEDVRGRKVAGVGLNLRYREGVVPVNEPLGRFTFS
jgi:hypothetical protein